MSLRNPIHAHAPQGPSPMPFDLEFRRSVRAFLAGNILERGGISRSGLGLIASGDPGFVRECIELGADVQLDTADTVRVQIGEPPFREQFCRELELFMELTGMKPWAVGWCSVRNAAFVTRLFGGSSPNLRTVDRVRSWMFAQLRGEQRRAVFGAAAAVASSATALPDCAAPAECPVPAENPRGRT